MKRILSIVLLICMLFALSVPSSAFAASITDFCDVSQSDWYYNSVSYVTEKGMFSGTSSSTFSPLDLMSRGMFVTVLGRYGGVSASAASNNNGVITHTDVNMRSLPTTDGSQVLKRLSINTIVEVYDLVADTSADGYMWYYIKYNDIMGYIRSDLMEAAFNSFDDVPGNAYYTPYVLWAASTFIASPTSENTFSPDKAITREEICSMLYNYAYIKNFQLNPTLTSRTFPDSSAISSSCLEAVYALQRTGVITGRSDGHFLPQGSATRAEVSTMLMRFVDAISYHRIDEPSIDANGNYIFGSEVPQSASVSSDYFSDACFIGHSLVMGTKDYSGINNSDYYAINGASTTTILNTTKFPLSTTHTDESGALVKDTGTLGQALSQKNYGKVYIMLGVNEIGTGSYHQRNFYNNMSTLISLVRKSQPTAKIYLISLTPVSQKLSESNKSVNRDNIIAFNGVLKQLCKDKQIYYLNAFDLFADGNGFLPDSLSLNDGLHIKAAAYKQLANYLYTHTIY